MNASLARIPKPLRFAAGAAGGLLVAAGVVVVTAQATGFHLGGQPAAVSAAATPAPTPSAAPTPMPSQPAMNSGQAAGRKAVLAAEAQVLGLKPKDLVTDVKSGQTVAQLAQQKGLSEDQFRTSLVTALQSSNLPSDTLQPLLQKLQTGAIPYWSGAAAK